MKAKAILLASVLLVGCQASNQDASIQQHAQSLSTAGQGEAGLFAGQQNAAKWMSNGLYLEQDENLWGFISDKLQMGIPENDRIREQKIKYLSHKSYLHDVTLRAEPYMYWIAGQVQKRNMPMELVLLPIVESAFDPHATSSANAAGIWQIVPRTGRSYGLKQTSSYDARRDIAASTTAALNIMRRLNKMFDGDWLLTIAAYNSGEGRVLKAIKANQAQGKPTDFWSLSLPRETQIYVPKMLALSDILKHSEKYGVNLPTTDESRALARVEINNPVDMAQVAEIMGMPLSKLKTFNAGVKTSIIGANSQRYIMVPKKHAARLKASLAAGEITTVQPDLIESLSESAPVIVKNTETPRKVYQVRTGDTLSSIASRLGVGTKELQSWNNLSGANIKVGQQLSIRGKGAQRLAKNSSIIYKVRKGDSISSIARRHGVNIKDVLRWNDGSDKLKPGDQLTLYVNHNGKPET